MQPDITKQIWALPFPQRVALLVLSVVDLHRETTPTIKAFSEMAIQMSRLSSSNERARAADCLRNAADEIERPALVIG
jgi:hypothetical protein